MPYKNFRAQQQALRIGQLTMHQSKSEKEKYLSHTTREIFYAKISNSTHNHDDVPDTKRQNLTVWSMILARQELRLNIVWISPQTGLKENTLILLRCNVLEQTRE
jgi:hypothetical protein